MRVQLWDEFEVAPDIEPNRLRSWCDECRRKTAYRYDQFDLPMCVEHTEDETQEA